MENENNLREKFDTVVRELDIHFPDLDLRYNFQCGNSSMRFYIADIDSNVIELDLRTVSARSLVQEATFCVKQTVRRFDA